MAQNNSGLKGFAADHIGASNTRSLEDRHFFGSFKTAGGLDITVAIVADGVGGGNLGQRAADLTIETVVKQLKESGNTENEIPQMLGAAIGLANRAVYQDSKKERGKSGMSSTISMALIHKSKLYVANVGDSRTYLIRSGEVKQITVDHTFANERIRQGVLTPEEAYQHPNAHAITRSIGFEPKVVVDLGLYIKDGQESGQEAYGNQGLLLGKDDLILVCSDGLIKESHLDPSRHYVENDDIIKTVQQYDSTAAAKVLVDLAVGRDADDNVTAIVVESASRKINYFQKHRAFIKWSGVSLALLVLLLIVGRQLIGVTGQLDELTQANISGTNTSMANTAIVAAFTPTPTVTPRPTMIPGEIGAIFINGNRQAFLVNTSVFASDFAEVHVNHTGEDEDGKIYLFNQSKILFEASPSETMNFVVFPDSQLFVYPGRYTAGAGMRIAGAMGTLDFSVSGSCMSLNYGNGKVIASCYEGTCSYQINYGDKVSIPVGTELEFDPNTLTTVATHDIPLSQVYAWLELLPHDTHASQCAATLVPVAAPTEKDNGNKDTEGQEPSLPPTSKPPTDPPATKPPTDPSDPPTQPPGDPSDPPTQPPEDPSDPPTQPPEDPSDPPPSDPPDTPPDEPPGNPDPPGPPNDPEPPDPTGEPTTWLQNFG